MAHLQPWLQMEELTASLRLVAKIPVAKGYVTDRAFDVCSLGVQVYGRYGYVKEYPMEQLLRDCRITQIYEGTNGIQAMDLLGR